MNNEIKSICVFGSGCPTCKKLFELTKEVVTELELNVTVEYSEDIQKIIEMGCIQSPVLTINDKPVLIGPVSNKEKIKQIIEKNMSGIEEIENNSDKSGGCSCGGHCC